MNSTLTQAEIRRYIRGVRLKAPVASQEQPGGQEPQDRNLLSGPLYRNPAGKGAFKSHNPILTGIRVPPLGSKSKVYLLTPWGDICQIDFHGAPKATMSDRTYNYRSTIRNCVYIPHLLLSRKFGAGKSPLYVAPSAPRTA